MAGNKDVVFRIVGIAEQMRCTNQFEAVGVFATGGAVGSVAFYPFCNEGMFFRQAVEVFLGQVSQPETPTLFAVEKFVGAE